MIGAAYASPRNLSVMGKWVYRKGCDCLDITEAILASSQDIDQF